MKTTIMGYIGIGVLHLGNYSTIVCSGHAEFLASTVGAWCLTGMENRESILGGRLLWLCTKIPKTSGRECGCYEDGVVLLAELF